LKNIFNLQLFADQLTDDDIENLLAEDPDEEEEDSDPEKGQSEDEDTDPDDEDVDDDDKEFQEKFKGDPKKLLKSYKSAHSQLGKQGTIIGELKSELAESRKLNAQILDVIKELKTPGISDKKPSNDDPLAGLTAEEISEKLMTEPDKILSQITKAAQKPVLDELAALKQQIQEDAESKKEYARVTSEIQELETQYGKEYTALKPLMLKMLEDERYAKYASIEGGMEVLFAKAKLLVEKRNSSRATPAEKQGARNLSRPSGGSKRTSKSDGDSFMQGIFGV
jgi:hypothetical protein